MKALLHVCCWVTMIVFLLCACERVDFSEEKKEQPDTTTVVPGEDTLKVLSVAEAQQLYYTSAENPVVQIAGYVVGTAGQFSMSGAVFDSPFSVAANILLADSPYERNYESCLPVRLENGSEERDDLNLVDNPSLLGQALLVEGVLELYYRVPGIKDVYDWKYIEIIENPQDTLTEKNFYPVVDENPEVIHGGRSLLLRR